MEKTGWSNVSVGVAFIAENGTKKVEEKVWKKQWSEFAEREAEN